MFVLKIYIQCANDRDFAKLGQTLHKSIQLTDKENKMAGLLSEKGDGYT